MRRVVLSHPLPVFGLVGRYPANYLIGRSPIPRCSCELFSVEDIKYYPQFPVAIPDPEAGTYVFLSLSPLTPSIATGGPFDLHA